MQFACASRAGFPACWNPSDGVCVILVFTTRDISSAPSLSNTFPDDSADIHVQDKPDKLSVTFRIYIVQWVTVTLM